MVAATVVVVVVVVVGGVPDVVKLRVVALDIPTKTLFAASLKAPLLISIQ